VVAQYARAGNWRESWIKDVRPCSTIDKYGPAPVDVLAAAINERAEGGRVGIELSAFPSRDLDGLRARTPGMELVDASSLIWNLRMVKTDEELSRLRRAYRVAEKVYERVFSEIRPGMTLRDIYRSEMDEVLAHDCFFLGQHLSFGNPGDRTHRGDPDYKVRTGDVGFFDLQVVYEGYVTDFGRVPVVGDATAEDRTLHEEIIQSRMAAAEMIRPGVRARDVVEEVGRVGARFPTPWVPDGVGHGLGLECHEPPFLRSCSNDVIEKGMVVVVEICRGRNGVTMLVEDAGVVAGTGWEPLSSLTTDLIRVG
jgi:Xaa-Pro aminopeptidase